MPYNLIFLKINIKQLRHTNVIVVVTLKVNLRQNASENLDTNWKGTKKWYELGQVKKDRTPYAEKEKNW